MFISSSATRRNGFVAGIVLAALCAPAAFAVPVEADTTMRESDVGEFSSNYADPTVVTGAYDKVLGVGGVSSDDYLLLPAMAEGAQDITLSFAAPEGYGYSYSAGGVILWSEDPFAGEWSGTSVDTHIQVDYDKPTQDIVFSLPESFAGTLYLALNFTHGEGLLYSILGSAGLATGPSEGGEGGGGVPDTGGVVETPAVPLPPALLLLGGAMALGGVFMRRRAA